MTCTVALGVLDNELSILAVDVRSEKIAERSKAFDKFDDYLNNREREIFSLLTGAVIKSTNTWKELFQSIFAGLVKQLNKSTEMDNKLRTCILVLQKFVNLANKASENIKATNILDKVFKICENRDYMIKIGLQFMKILQKNVLECTHINKNRIKIEEWDRIIGCCIRLFETNKFPPVMVVQCISVAITCALQQSFISNELHKYLSKIKIIILELEKGAAQNEWISVAYCICLAVGVDNRKSVCEFLEDIAKPLYKAYDTRLDIQMKETLFKIMHLSLVIHSPMVDFKAKSSSDFFVNESEWNKCLRNFHYIVTTEMKHIAKQRPIGKTEPSMIEPFVQFAKRLCMTVLWNENIWNENDSGGQPSKKLKMSNGFKSVIDFVEESENNFSWSWFVLLGELCFEMPKMIDECNFRELLFLLSRIQPTIQYSIQMEALNKLVSALLFVSQQLSVDVEVAKTHDDVWKKIFDFACRSCMVDRLHLENHSLLQLFIKHNKCTTPEFITTFIDSFESETILRTNTSLRTIIEILKNFNMESLRENNLMVKKILNYVYRKPQQLSLKKIMLNDEKIETSVIGQVSVLCILSKEDVIKLEECEKFTQPHLTGVFANKNYSTYNADLKNIEILLQLKYLDKFVLEVSPTKTNRVSDSGLSHDLKCAIDENLFEHLRRVMEIDIVIERPKNSDAVHYIEMILNNLCRYLQILDGMIRFESLNEEKFRSCILTKKVHYYVQELELCFEQFTSEELSDKELFDLIQKLEPVFDIKLHATLGLFVRTSKMKDTINWIGSLIRKFKPEIDHRALTELKEYSILPIRTKIRYAALKLMAHYIKYSHGVDADLCLATLTETEFLYKANCDIYCVINLMGIVVQAEPTEKLADWIMTQIMELCELYVKNMLVSQHVLLLFPDILKFLSVNKSDQQCTNNVGIALRTFAERSLKGCYSVPFVVIVLDQIKYLCQSYPSEFNNKHHRAVYKLVTDFLQSPVSSIAMKAVEVCGIIMQSGFLSFCEENEERMEFQLEFITKLGIDRIITKTETPDSMDNKQGACLQLISTIIKCNYSFREKFLYKLAEFCSTYLVHKDKANKTLQSIAEYLNYMSQEDFLSQYLQNLLESWIGNSHTVSEFPWFITNSESISNFVDKHFNTVVLATFRKVPDQISHLAEIAKTDVPTLLLPIIPVILAYLTPSYTDNINMTNEYTVAAKSVNETLVKYNINIDLNFTEQLPKVIELLFDNLIDNEKMKQTINVKYPLNSNRLNNINFDMLVSCLTFLEKYKTFSKNSLIHHLCLKYPRQIECILLEFKNKYQFARVLEEKLKILFQLSVFVEFLAKYVKSVQTTEKLTSKNFFVRDLCYFFCYKISSKDDMDKKLLPAICFFFKTFLQQILPNCSNEFAPILNQVVITLLPLCDENTNIISSLPFEILSFLIVDQKIDLMKSIANLDNFPDGRLFDKMRESYAFCKYKNKQFSLRDEINHFLRNDNRKLEGLITLRQAISSKKDELIKLYEEIQTTHGFLEECQGSVIHRLIHALIRHIQSKDRQRSLEAAKCLGEIGPAKLLTIVFKETSSFKCGNSNTAEEALRNLYVAALEKLNNLLVHPDVTVVKFVSDAAYYLLNFSFTHTYVEKLIYLEPFVHNGDDEPLKLSVQNCNLGPTFDQLRYASYSEWIKVICRELFLCFSDSRLHQVSSQQLSFAEMMLPVLVEAILYHRKKDINNNIMIVVNNFFKEHVDHGTSSEPSIYSNKMVINSMITIVECIRVFVQKFPDEKIELNFLHIAKAAIYNKAFFKAILYSEIWVLENDKSSNNELFKNNESLQNIMIDAYLSLGLNDAVTAFVDPIKLRSMHYQLQNSWNRVLLETDSICGFNKSFGDPALLEKLKCSGLYVTAYSKEQSQDFECAWRLGDWNLLPSKTGTTTDLTKLFEQHQYFALKSLYNKDKAGVELSLLNARNVVVNLLKSESLECSNTLYKYLRMLQQMQQIEDFCEVQFRTEQNVHTAVLKKWAIQDKLDYYFSSKESLLAQRLTIFNASDKRAKRTWIPEAIQKNVMNLIVSSRIEGQQNITIKNIAIMSAMDLLSDVKAQLVLEDAMLSITLGDNYLGKCLLKSLIDDEKLKNTLIHGQALRLYGMMLAETCTKDAKFIQNKYFKLASDIFLIHEKNLDAAGIKKQIVIYETIAKHADRVYTQLKTHTNSTKHKEKIRFIEKNEEAIKQLRKSGKQLNKDDKRQQYLLTKTAEHDREELKQTDKDIKEFLTAAIVYYARNAIDNIDSTNLSVFRVVSLWLSNATEESIVEIAKKFLMDVPSFKLIDILPQLSARIGDTNEYISMPVFDVLERCAKEHPHHTLPHIMALVNAYADDPSYKSSDADTRLSNAKRLLTKLKKVKKLNKMIVELEQLNHALILFANDSNSKPTKLPAGASIKKISILSNIYCSTITVPVKSNGNYDDNVIGILKYKDKWELVGGVNAPKKIFCMCLDGVERSQLLKGQDDLRQDAVMQQVFVIMNSFLRVNKSTNELKLQVRTYKVVPLAKRSGILEWCSNTIPIGMFLVGDKSNIGAHGRYRPNDLSASECRIIVQKYSQQPPAKQKKLLEEILEKIKPVFHYFFLERFVNPGVWFERQQAYRNSVATNSIIGYILGIGDRHVQNILIDQQTAELIHIDFGIAFEQGKLLHHPELIPFRLTRDIVSGMGMSGVEGVFRKSCEKTLEVLRQNQNTILTILEVLLYDPLYAWTLTSEEAYKRQKINVSTEVLDTERNTMADRCLARLRDKLNGRNEDQISSVEGQVDYLITEAMNHDHWSKLFHGWQPYL